MNLVLTTPARFPTEVDGERIGNRPVDILELALKRLLGVQILLHDGHRVEVVLGRLELRDVFLGRLPRLTGRDELVAEALYLRDLRLRVVVVLDGRARLLEPFVSRRIRDGFAEFTAHLR